MEKEIKSNVAGIRKAIGSKLRKENIKFNYSLLLSKCYCGEGFYVNHKLKVNELKPIYGYDRNGAYMGSLKTYNFPLSSEMTNEKTELGIVHIKFSRISPRYKEFYYTIYQNNIEAERNNGKVSLHLYLTELDFQIFTDLYDTDYEVVGQKYFKNIGKLPLDDVVDKYYERKKLDEKSNKYVYEAGFYGMFAKKLWRDKMSNVELMEFYNAMEDCGLNIENEVELKIGKKYLRNNEVCIAMWQTAYLRYEEWKLFKQYIDSVVYMNTDSIYCQKKFDLPVDTNCGGNKREYDGELIFWVRRNAYIVVDANYNIKKAILGGIIEDHGLDTNKVNQLANGQTVQANTKDKDGNIVPIDLTPNFLLYKYQI